MTLIPVLLSFFVGAPPEGETGYRWNSALLFTGMLASLARLRRALTPLLAQAWLSPVSACGRSTCVSSRNCKQLSNIILARTACELMADLDSV
jgi:hypothetical protein